MQASKEECVAKGRLEKEKKRDDHKIRAWRENLEVCFREL